jgi:hypothetical protein
VDLELVCTGLADAVRAYGIAGLTCLDYVPDRVSPPTFYTAEVEIDYNGTFRGDPDVRVTCRVLTSRSNDQSGQALLKRYMASSGANSIKAALESGSGAPGQAALNGACDDLHVRRLQGHRLYTVGENSYFGAEWIVHVFGDGD